MAAIAVPQQTGEHIRVPAWAFAVMALLLFGAYVVLQENGWIVSNWETIHEFFHDGRHALGLPCH
ncbi:MAG: CbtB domain-containing protein [Acidimicrobiales bacterium]